MRWCVVLVCFLFIPVWDIQAKESLVSTSEADRVLEQLQEGDDSFSLGQYVEDVMNGKADFSLQTIWDAIVGGIEKEINRQKNTILQILALGLMAGVFLNFAGTVGEKDLSDTGFYITIMLLFATMSAGFYTTFSVAEEAVSQLLLFMKALIPSFSLSICFTASTGSSIAFYETMLIGIGLLEALMLHVFLPGVQVYFLLSMVNQLADNRFSKMADLIRSFLRWSLKMLFGLLIGFQGIQGLLFPVMDKVKNNTLLQGAKGLPGVGNTVGSVADTILGSGMLIKSAIGVGGIIAIAVLCFLPLVKLLIFVLIYRVGAAVVQPISDKRMVTALQAGAESGKLLFGYVFAGALMFVLSITIILVSTNMTG